MERECENRCEERYDCCDCGVDDQDFGGCGCHSEEKDHMYPNVHSIVHNS